MFAQLPKLFDKEFFIGYFVPTFATLIAILAILEVSGFGVEFTNFLEVEKFLDVALGLLVVWLASIALMAINRSVIRVLEGYGRVNPFKLIEHFQLRQFDILKGDLADLKTKKGALEKEGERIPDDLRENYGEKLRAWAEQFPDQRSLVLPTRFGNTLRAFEVYSRVIYGLDAIGGWERLLGVVPKEFQAQIAAEKAQLDFWVNLWFGGIVVAAVYGVLGIACNTWPQPWIPFLGLAFSFAASQFARGNAREWGVLVMTAFDLYRGDLAAKMGFELPRSIVEERAFWQLFSQAIIYRSSTAMERLTMYRKHRQN